MHSSLRVAWGVPLVRLNGLTRTGDGTVKQYRLYFVDGSGKVASAPHEFEADADETAVRVAEAWREGRRGELWSGSRRVETWR